jgi:hypothetical protein
MSDSIWDDPAVTGGNNEFVKFEKVGDSVSGKVENIGRKTWDDGSVSPQLDLLTDDGEARTLTAGQTRLKAALAEQRPEVGDHLSVTLTQIEKRSGGKTLKHFDVTVKKAAGATTAPSAADDDAPPF